MNLIKYGFPILLGLLIFSCKHKKATVGIMPRMSTIYINTDYLSDFDFDQGSLYVNGKSLHRFSRGKSISDRVLTGRNQLSIVLYKEGNLIASSEASPCQAKTYMITPHMSEKLVIDVCPVENINSPDQLENLSTQTVEIEAGWELIPAGSTFTCKLQDDAIESSHFGIKRHPDGVQTTANLYTSQFSSGLNFFRVELEQYFDVSANRYYVNALPVITAEFTLNQDLSVKSGFATISSTADPTFQKTLPIKSCQLAN